MKHLTSIAVLVAALAVLPVTAAAKGGPIVSLAVCGASGCTRVSDYSTFRSLQPYLFGERADRRNAPPIGPYYRLVARVRWLPNPKVTSFLVPGTGITNASHDAWTTLPARTLTALTTAAAGQRPLRPTLVGVDVDSHPVSDPASYAALLRPLRVPARVSAAEWSAPWTYVTLQTAQSVPFRSTFIYVPIAHAVSILGGAPRGYAIPGGLEDVIRADAGLPPIDRGSSRMPAVAASTVITVLAAVGLVLLVRRARPGLRREAGHSD